jgi:hypothetical protein
MLYSASNGISSSDPFIVIIAIFLFLCLVTISSLLPDHHRLDLLVILLLPFVSPHHLSLTMMKPIH